MRVISLLPGATEMVAALGGLEHLVGITHACDHPQVVTSRAVVTTRGASGFTLHEDRIRALHPDLILTQALCDVCAVSETDVRALAARLDPVPRIVTLAATTLEGVLDEMRVVGAAIGLADEAEEFAAGAFARLRAVHETLKAAKAPRPRVAVIEWGDPLYAAGHWMPGMISRAGGVDVLASPGTHSVIVTVETVREAAPDVVIIAPCGYGVDRAASEGDRLLAQDAWSWARTRRVFAIDANAFTSRPGPRLVDGVEVLARCLNPALFSPLDPAFARTLARTPAPAALAG